MPLALARAIHVANTPAKGPAFVSVPMDDWEAEVTDADADAAIDRGVAARSGPDPDAMTVLAEKLDAATNPVFVAGPDIDAAGAWETAVALVERLNLPVFAIPAPGGGRPGPRGASQLPRRAAARDRPALRHAQGPRPDPRRGLSVFPYYPNIPGELLPEGADLVQLTSDPDEAARAPMGNAIVGDVKLALLHLLGAVAESDRDAGEPRRSRSPGRSRPDHRHRRNERAPRRVPRGRHRRARGAVRDPRRSQPAAHLPSRELLLGAGGGLGFGLAAAVGVQLAQPDRPVVCVVGEGSAQYAITALWSAAAYSAPITVLVLRNSEYAILKWFADIEGVGGAPGLDLPSLSCLAVADGYGVPAREVAGGRDGFVEALRDAVAAGEPRLVEVPVAPGMWLF